MDKKYNIVKDIEDVRDIIYRNNHKVKGTLPLKVDLRPKCSPIVDQGNLGSCTSNAIVSGLREYILINDEKKPLIRLSRLFVYWWERDFEGTINEDSGATLRNGMKVLYKYGTCTEQRDPYDVNNFREQPSNDEMNEAQQYKIPGYERLLTLVQIKDALTREHPVVFSMELYESFEGDELRSTGMVPYPQPNEQLLGGHAMCIVGYDDTLNGGSFIVRNSWGEQWGDKGYCYLPYSMMKYFYDAWTIKYGKKGLTYYLTTVANIFGDMKDKLFKH